MNSPSGELPGQAQHAQISREGATSHRVFSTCSELRGEGAERSLLFIYPPAAAGTPQQSAWPPEGHPTLNNSTGSYRTNSDKCMIWVLGSPEGWPHLAIGRIRFSTLLQFPTRVLVF